jgi:hypothetical protein
MRVSELIDILNDQDPESEVELAIVAPVDDDSDDISIDRYTVAAVLPWEPSDGEDDEAGVWLVGGEDDDVEAFIDAVEGDDIDDDDDGHDHD